MKYFLGFILFMAMGAVYGDNLRIHEAVKIVPVTDDGVDLEIRLSWSNSWRNAYNYDAVYLFGKFRTEEGTSDWGHVYFDTTSSLQSATEGYTVKVVNEGRGVFVYRTAEQRGIATVTLRLRWKIAGNTSRVLTREQFDKKQVRVSMHGLEMAYVPASPFYAGDGSSGNSFSDPGFGTLPAAYDIIGTSTNYTYSGNGSETAAAYVNRPADRFDRAVYNANDRRDWCGTVMPATWQVDFKSPKTIRYFGVSGVCWQQFPSVPASDWYLEGSADARTWTDLWHGGPEYWGQSATSYPVQRAIRVTNPGAYRYYRVRVNDNQCADSWNNIRIANVAMSEVGLDTLGKTNNLLIDGYHRNFPDHYPLGVNGFYAMKYELTQEQYVVFLNQLSRSGQYTRTIGGLLDGIKEGEYVFGDSRNTPSHRNGIILLEHSLDGARPYVFACDLNPGNSPGDVDDGQAVACNYLSPADMLAYADWSGLRPLSELEYEKMCRGNYPSFPSGGEAAWGQSPPVFISGLVSEGRADESFREADANVNAGGGVDGPVRVGMFVRPGNREQAGNSFWGISDLSGNLSGIYYNTDLYGRQLDGRVHGGGDLNVNGSAVIGRASWPVEAEAFGVRGGDYTSHAGQLAVSCRENMSGYFGDLEERRPVAGVRLGFSPVPKVVNSVLTLENGLKSGDRMVYDTVCDASEYIITGDQPENSGVCRYLWLRSTDDGDTWLVMDGENNRDLKFSGLTDGIDRNTIRKYLFKRLLYTPEVCVSSGIVGVIAGNGYTFSALSDTIQPCMASKEIKVTTLLPATFEWKNLAAGNLLETQDQPMASVYEPKIGDFAVDGNLDSKEYDINVTIRMAGRCQVSENVRIVAYSFTKNPFRESVENVVYANKDEYQVEYLWTGKDPMSWKIVEGQREGLSLDAATGVLSGLSERMCYEMTVELTCADYPDKVYRKKLKELVRDYSYTGDAQALKLLPGTYQMECWGANGGVGNGGSNPVGLGGYTQGSVVFPAEQTMYLYVGEYGNGQRTSVAFNGGGAAYSTAGHNGGRGGGATDIRLTGGSWNNRESLLSRVMVAAGGGGAMPNCGGASATAGYGGGLVGGTSKNQAGSYVNNTSFGGSQTAGGSFALGSSPNNNGVRGAFGVGANAGTCAAGGGSGYYGGGSLYTSGGGGGSSFISGHAGCDAVDAGGAHTGEAIHFSGLLFTDTRLLGGNESVEGRPANGYGRIRITVVRY